MRWMAVTWSKLYLLCCPSQLWLQTFLELQEWSSEWQQAIMYMHAHDLGLIPGASAFRASEIVSIPGLII